MGIVWQIVKVAATKIPWRSVVENAPAVADFVGKAKEKFRSMPEDDLVNRLRLLHEENQKLEKVLLQTAAHLQELEDTLKVVAARQKTLTIATVVSALLAVSALLLWITK
jgi:BMFP domain-containing protein YqiC